MGANGQAKVDLAGAYHAYQREQAKASVLLSAPVKYRSASRQKQLDTLLHLSHFSDYLILVNAIAGAGKTTFLHHFMQAQPTDTCVLHIAPTDTLTAPQLVKQLLAQMPGDRATSASLDEAVHGVQELAVQLAASGQVLLIVVDDAHYLDDEALALLANVLPAHGADGGRPHVVLLAEPELAVRLEDDAYQGLRQERYYQLNLAPFTADESRAYLQKLVVSMELPGEASIHPEQLDQLHSTAGGVPGYLEMLLRQAIRQGGLQQQAGLPLWHILAIVVVMLAVLVLWWLNGEERSQDEQAGAQQLVTESVSSDAALANQPAETSVEPVVQAKRQPLPVLEPVPLSPQTKYQSLKPKDDVEPVSQEGKATDLVDPQQGQATDKLLAQTQALQASLDVVAKDVAEQVTRPEAMVIKPAKAPVSAAPEVVPQVVLSASEQAFMDLPKEHYTLQLLGARYGATAEQYVRRLQGIALPSYTLKLSRGGEDWYVVLMGDFASSSAAKDALGDLPRHVRDLQPWARPVLRLQQQLVNKINTGGE